MRRLLNWFRHRRAIREVRRLCLLFGHPLDGLSNKEVKEKCLEIGRIISIVPGDYTICIVTNGNHYSVCEKNGYHHIGTMNQDFCIKIF
jgi:hypothetical protein